MYIDFKSDRLKSFDVSLAFRSSYDKQLNAFDKSANSAPNESPLSSLNLYFSNIAIMP